MDNAAESLLHELEKSPTDLKKLVVSALWREHSAVAIESEAIARWERDDPHRWALVREWLLSQGITITVLLSKAPAASRGAARSPLPQPPSAGVPD
jgi:hypothetical protein